MTVAFVDETDFGTDVALLTNLSPVWGLASGPTNLAYSQLRRLTTPAGALDEIEDEPFDSIDLRGYLNARLDRARLSNLKSRIETVCEADPRVESCEATLTFDLATKTLRIDIHEETAEGPFDLAMSASAVTVDILSVNGVQVQAAAVAEESIRVIALQGAPGQPGVQGPAGSSGTPDAHYNFGDVDPAVSSSGAEEVVAEWLCRFGDLSTNLTVALIGELLSTAGTATVRVRVGGSAGTADGTVAVTMTGASTSYTPTTQVAALVNPTGNLYVKVTMQSSAGGQSGKIRKGSLTFR